MKSKPRQFCGTRLWKEISLEEAELISHMLPNLDENPPWSHRCRMKRDTISWGARLVGIIRTTIPMSSASQRYTPPGSAISSSTTGRGIQSTGVGQSNMGNQDQSQQQGVVVAGQQSTAALVHPATAIQSWVLFGVQGSRRTLEINHIPINNQSNDSSFYRSLRQHYRTNRGRLKLWLSFWRLDYCEVVKAWFDPLPLYCNRC